MRSRGILFGLGYSAGPPEIKLNGSINDVKNMAEYLSNTFDMPLDIYTDETGPQNTTRMAMIKSLYEFALRSFSDDLEFAWIHYSGHGSYVRDLNGDERDGRDECIVPSDFAAVGLVPDDIMESLFRHFNPDTRVVCIFDCCHSGTVGDVKYSWESPNRVRVENILCEVRAPFITLSASMDNQIAYEILTNKEYHGAMTYCLLMVLKDPNNKDADIFQILEEVRKKLKEIKVYQKPQLCSTYNLAKKRQFLPPLLEDKAGASKQKQSVKISGIR